MKTKLRIPNQDRIKNSIDDSAGTGIRSGDLIYVAVFCGMYCSQW